MCMFCATVPVVGAVGAKINFDQNRNGTRKINFPKGLIITVIYHTYFLSSNYG